MMFRNLLFLQLFYSSIIFSQKHDSIDDFRNISWGASPSVVREIEKAEYLQQSSGLNLSTLSFNGRINGIPARIDYTFRHDSLIEGSYSIVQLSSFEEMLLSLKNYLSQLYGKPDYANVNALIADSMWSELNPGIFFNGPQYFWEFADGFISIAVSKFISSSVTEEVTITILHVSKTRIEDYSASRLIPLDKFQRLGNGANP